MFFKVLQKNTFSHKKSKSMQGFQNLKNYPRLKTMLRMEGCPLLCRIITNFAKTVLCYKKAENDAYLEKKLCNN